MGEIPVIVGAAQIRQAPGVEDPKDPMGLMYDAGARALSDSGAKSLAEIIDCVWVSNIMSWGYKNAPLSLARSLGIEPSDLHYSTISGSTPQYFINQAARSVSLGKARAVLMAGGEAQFTAKKAFKGLISTAWPPRENPEKVGDGAPLDVGTNSLENSFRMMLPVNMYAMFETALRKATGAGVDEHRMQNGRLFERFSAAASSNPIAWDRRAYTAEEIATPGPDNPIACHPYTRRMTANMNVDMSAAIVLTSEKEAARMGVDRAKWVYPMGGSDLENIYHVTRRPRLDDSPAIAAASRISLEQAGLSIADIDAFDLYSCFPSMVQITMNELGLSMDEHRPLTVTGGLPFFGGPMCNYSMHAIAQIVDIIRQNPETRAMVTANGGFNTRHSIGVYGGGPGVINWEDRDDSHVQEQIRSMALPEPEIKAEGRMEVDGFIIRESPWSGAACGRLESGARTLAAIDADENDLKEFAKLELAGSTGAVRFDEKSGRNLVTVKL